MNTTLILFILGIILSSIGLFKIFEKANVPGWKAFVPFLNWSEWLKIIGKPQWWIVLLFIPIVNVFYMAYMLIGLAKAFKHYDLGSHAAAVLAPYIYLPYLGFSKNEKYYGPDGLRPGERHPEKTAMRGWIDSIVFAVIAAHLIRTFLIEAYKIPTSSMEPTLQIGDYMFVSKLNYGPRLPNTPLSLPLVHHTIPGTSSRAYTDLVQWDYYRFPGFQKVKRNDIIVFNVPFEYNMQSSLAKRYYPNIKYKSRPVDKREHYIKRVVGMPGDKLQIKDNQLYINDAAAQNPELMQFSYHGKFKRAIPREDLRNYGIRAYTNYFNGSQNPEIYGDQFYVNATPKAIEQLKKDARIENVALNDLEQNKSKPYAYYPVGNEKRGWTVVNYGPIIIPAKGLTLTITPENFDLYREPIAVHESNELELTKDGQIKINGEITDKYTFKMDYYWLMGDNRHASLDSRDWGFVPESHVVGKPLFIFWSSQPGPGNIGLRTKRIFKKAQDMN